MAGVSSGEAFTRGMQEEEEHSPRMENSNGKYSCRDGQTDLWSRNLRTH